MLLLKVGGFMGENIVFAIGGGLLFAQTLGTFRALFRGRPVEPNYLISLTGVWIIAAAVAKYLSH